MKKITLVSFAVLAALASQHAAAQSKFEGLSFSAGLGMVGANTTLSGATSMVDGDNTTTASGGIDFGKTSNVAVLDLGYGFRLKDNFVLGTGATLDLGNTKSGAIRMGGSDMPSGDLISLVGKKHMSVYVQPTWLLTPDTGVFAKVSYHRMHRSQDGLLGAMLPEGMSTAMNLNGMGLGLGVKSYITSKVFVQAEVTTVSYKSKDLTAIVAGQDTLPLPDGSNLTAKVKTTTGIVSIGMNF